MPLSDDEKRQLDLIARSLYAEDPAFANGLSHGKTTLSFSSGRKRTAVGVIVTLAGLAGLLGGVALPSVVLGVAGFAGMLAGVRVAYAGFATRADLSDD